MALTLALSPQGHVYVNPHDEPDPESSTENSVRTWFAEHHTSALLRLGASKMENHSRSATLVYWQNWVLKFIEAKRKLIAAGNLDTPSLLESIDLDEFCESSPPMLGGEYLSCQVLQDMWHQLDVALKDELQPHNGDFFAYLAQYHPDWQKVGRVCFHLAENKSSPNYPFAFMATYTTGFSASKGTIQHVSLGQALREYSGDQNKQKLLQLLMPVQKAAQSISWVKEYVDSGHIFHPQRWTAEQAYAFLISIAHLEEAGLHVRVPNWWKPQHPPRPQVSIAVGNKVQSMVGMDTLLDFNMSYALPDGTRLSDEEMHTLMHSHEPLVVIRGQWVEVDTKKIAAVVDHWKNVEKQVKRDGMTFAEGLRFLAGTTKLQSLGDISHDVVAWSKIKEGPWLQEIIHKLRHPEQQEDQSVEDILNQHLHARLRPYQIKGVQWLWFLYQLGFGGCLADDMGLGKTIQVIALFLLVRHAKPGDRPQLLVVPASLLGNWRAEIQRFAPGLRLFIAHSTAEENDSLKNELAPDFQDIDVVMTTYGNVHRLPWVRQQNWNMIILDEAQSIKNPSAKQTQTVKSLKSVVRFILTGTPVENKLLDLWSLFDFCSPGLLGSSKEFSQYGKKSANAHGSDSLFYSVVRKLTSPYILRRLKTDRSIIQDLPDKTECNVHCFLSKRQVALYQQSVCELEQRLNDPNMEPMARRGLVLSYLMRFKQICNHPSQWLGHGVYAEEESGKFAELRSLCEIIEQKQEKVLIFTQYKEIIPHLHDFVASIFGRSGITLHGQTPIKDRSNLVQAFQEEEGPPFFVLSIKAGGTGLTLTRASHVIHFDRWWNPAVENQATDRAYRIGQKKNVLVHKFICQGTLEEKIHTMIENKKNLASNILGAGNGEASLSELSNAELINMISLDIHRASTTE